jgi:hypothetical protein
MPPSTRELNVKVIAVVTTVSTLLLITIVLLANAGYLYFASQQVEARRSTDADATFQATRQRLDNRDLAEYKVMQGEELDRSGEHPHMELVEVEGKKGEFEMRETRRDQKMPIDKAMKRVAERY